MITANEIAVDFPRTPTTEHIHGQTYVLIHYLKGNPKGFFKGIRSVSSLNECIKNFSPEETQNMFRELTYLGLPALATDEWLSWVKANYL